MNFRLAVNKKGAATKDRKPVGKGKAVKDPNMPKRPPSAFYSNSFFFTIIGCA